MHLIKEAIIKTISYADIFEYPLTQPEIEKWLCSKRATSPIAIEQHLKELCQLNLIAHSGNYYYLSGKAELVGVRSHRSLISSLKRAKADHIARELINVPFIEAIFLTGAVAMSNATDQDDIDIMIITSKNSLYSCRLFVSLMLELRGLKRHPGSMKVNNKICPNLYLAADALKVPENQQNIYTAHEVAQAIPLADPYNFHAKFWNQNKWISQYLANVQPPKMSKMSTKIHKFKSAPALFESIMRQAQCAYMQSKKTREIVTPQSAYFHPRDTSGIVLGRFNQSIKKYI